MGFVRYIKNHFHHVSFAKKHLTEIDGGVRRVNRVAQELQIGQRINYLNDRTCNSHEMGITTESVCPEELIVSLTTYGQRIYDVYLTIESIMQGFVKPNRIILWLAEDEFKGKRLPESLRMQEKRGLEIRYCADLRSYKKLIPTLALCPDATIVTIDDDVMYDVDFLDHLLAAHAEHPRMVCAGRVHRIRLDHNGAPLSYLQWQECVTDAQVSPLNFFTGIGGVLYPPHCLDADVYDTKLFQDLCPSADDIWFYVMLLKKGTSIVKSYTKRPDGDYVYIHIGQTDGLCIQNTDKNNCANDVQFDRVMTHYDLYSALKND